MKNAAVKANSPAAKVWEDIRGLDVPAQTAHKLLKQRDEGKVELPDEVAARLEAFRTRLIDNEVGKTVVKLRDFNSEHDSGSEADQVVSAMFAVGMNLETQSNVSKALKKRVPSAERTALNEKVEVILKEARTCHKDALQELGALQVQRAKLVGAVDELPQSSQQEIKTLDSQIEEASALVNELRQTGRVLTSLRDRGPVREYLSSFGAGIAINVHTPTPWIRVGASIYLGLRAENDLGERVGEASVAGRGEARTPFGGASAKIMKGGDKGVVVSAPMGPFLYLVEGYDPQLKSDVSGFSAFRQHMGTFNRRDGSGGGMFTGVWTPILSMSLFAENKDLAPVTRYTARLGRQALRFYRNLLTEAFRGITGTRSGGKPKPATDS